MSAPLWLVAGVLGALAQDRPSEQDLFGAPEPDGGVARPSEQDLFGAAEPDAGSAAADAGADRDSAQLVTGIANRFDTQETVSDPLKIGGSLLMTGQAFFSEGRPTAETPFSAPMVLDTYLDARPNDRLRAYAVGRLQFDPTRPLGTASAAGTALPMIGVTSSGQTNPSVYLDQLWLRFDILRKVYFTVGRQKVRWGTARIWYPTDFLNSQPRDALNPFDVRLGVNLVKVHVPVEALGWNFYGYGILDNLDVSSAAPYVSIDRLGGAARAEFVVGPAEIGLGGVWMKGRRPRYAIDVSSALGPFDVYAEAAFRSGKDFLKFKMPADLTANNVFEKALDIAASAYRPDGIVVQVSGGLSWQFNYTDKNFAVLAAEYFYNPVGYDSPPEYLVQTFFPGLIGQPVDPIQKAPLYGGRHNLAIIASLPGLPELTWVTVNVSNIIRISDPSGLVRLDAIFRVLTYLQVQVFAQFFYGKTGGELRFQLPDEVINQLLVTTPADQRDAARVQLNPLRYPPLAQVGVLLRLSL